MRDGLREVWLALWLPVAAVPEAGGEEGVRWRLVVVVVVLRASTGGVLVEDGLLTVVAVLLASLARAAAWAARPAPFL